MHEQREIREDTELFSRRKLEGRVVEGKLIAAKASFNELGKQVTMSTYTMLSF